MIKFFHIISALLIVLIFLSCAIEDATAPKLDYEPEVVVFGLLLLTENDDEGQKTIRIERSFEITDKLPLDARNRAITDAKVFIETEDQRVQFLYTFDSNYEDIYNRLNIVPGQTYKLNITLADGRNISAQCIMPSKPEIISPRVNAPVEAYKPLDVTWQNDEFAYVYELSIEEEMESFSYSEFSASTEEEILFFVLAPPGKYFLKVASLDQNYYDYLRTSQSRQPISNIDGGLGVFGAMAYNKSKFFAVLP